MVHEKTQQTAQKTTPNSFICDRKVNTCSAEVKNIRVLKCFTVAKYGRPDDCPAKPRFACMLANGGV